MVLICYRVGTLDNKYIYLFNFNIIRNSTLLTNCLIVEFIFKNLKSNVHMYSAFKIWDGFPIEIKSQIGKQAYYL